MLILVNKEGHIEGVTLHQIYYLNHGVLYRDVIANNDDGQDQRFDKDLKI